MRKTRSSKKEVVATGILHVHPRGFGFLTAEDRTRFPVDIFIPRHATKGAVDGDRVEVIVSPSWASEKGPEGSVKSILCRGRSHVAGTIAHTTERGESYAYVPLLGEGKEMHILPSSERPLSVGDRIIIHVLHWGSATQESRGEMSAYIGSIEDPSCDVRAAIEAFDLHDAFPEEALEEAKEFGAKVRKKDLGGREDFREWECFTIDPDTAKDFDDALSLTRDEAGHYHLGVHIADVSYYVTPGSLLDQEARTRCNSVYLPGRVLPMLPHELSSHLCSLKPEVDRLTVSVLMHFDPTGVLVDYRITRAIIRSKRRFTYREAKALLDSTTPAPHKEALERMVALCLLLKRQRVARGSIEFALPDLSVVVDAEGVPQEITLIEYDITHQLVEEFMLKANEIVACHLHKQGKPLTYRIHDEPDPEQIKDFAATASALGFPLPTAPTSEELQQLFDTIREHPFGQFLTTQFIRSMKLASYSTQNIGHYGLGLEYYTHFTSPIRRYVDLLIHRLLFSSVEEDYDQIALHCSEKERLSSRAENSVILLKKLRLLKRAQQESAERTYRAVVTQTKPFGALFEVSEWLLEGFLHYKGERRRRLRVGDTLWVQPTLIDLITQEVRWTPAPKKT